MTPLCLACILFEESLIPNLSVLKKGVEVGEKKAISKKCETLAFTLFGFDGTGHFIQQGQNFRTVQPYECLNSKDHVCTGGNFVNYVEMKMPGRIIQRQPAYSL